MQADYSLELGRDDHALELPWASPDGTQRYLDLKRQPELLLNVLEAADNRDLAEFLVTLNGATTPVETAKCDTWRSDEIHPEEEIFGAPWKFGSYVDVVFTAPGQRALLDQHQSLARNITALLQRVPDFAAAAEFIVRRCYSHSPDTLEHGASEDGFCITIYVSGFGDHPDDARKNWVIGLKVVQNALMQLLARPHSRVSGPA
jgi:hypothetical protein